MSIYASIAIMIGIAGVFAIGIPLAYRSEKKQFNNGKCPYCGADLKWKDVDSQGGRLWMCMTHYTLKDEHGKPVCPGYSCWVSFNRVDKNFK